MKEKNAMFIWVWFITLSIMISSSYKMSQFHVFCKDSIKKNLLPKIPLYVNACMRQTVFAT